MFPAVHVATGTEARFTTDWTVASPVAHANTQTAQMHWIGIIFVSIHFVIKPKYK